MGSNASLPARRKTQGLRPTDFRNPLDWSPRNDRSSRFSGGAAEYPDPISNGRGASDTRRSCIGQGFIGPCQIFEQHGSENNVRGAARLRLIRLARRTADRGRSGDEGKQPARIWCGNAARPGGASRTLTSANVALQYWNSEFVRPGRHEASHRCSSLSVRKMRACAPDYSLRRPYRAQSGIRDGCVIDTRVC